MSLFFRRSPNYSEANLPEIIAGCKEEKPAAQRALVQQYYSFAKGICLKYAASEQEAEEIINDGFMKIFAHLNKYDTQQSFKAWLRTVMTNTAIDYYRRNQKFSGNVGLEHTYELSSVEPSVIERISAEEIINLIQQLPTSCRMVFTLYVVEGYSHKEIAEKLGIKEGTSKSNLSDARIKLQILIQQSHPQMYAAYSVKLNEN